MSKIKFVSSLAVSALVGITIFAAAAAGADDKRTTGEMSVEQLIRKANESVGACRSLRGEEMNDPELKRACSKRDETYEQLTKMGYCFGPADVAEAQKDWGKCDAMKAKSEPRPAKRTWFIADKNSTACFDGGSPANRIRQVQDAGFKAEAKDKPNGAVEVGYWLSNGNFMYWTYYPSESACVASLPRNQSIPSRYE